MLNEVSPLITTLNSYISCRGCQVTYDTEVILKCGHVICKECKVKQTKCPSCYSDISTTRENTPSVKFVAELFEELLKSTPGHPVENEVKNPVPAGKKITKLNEPFCVSCENTSLRESNIVEQISEESDSDIICIKELRTCSKEKSKKPKKRILFYGKYSKDIEESEFHKKILHGLGIAGIDKKIENVETPNLNASEIEWNGKLNTIISRLNCHNGEKQIDTPSMMDKRKSLVLVHSNGGNSSKEINRNSTNNFKETAELKRRTSDDCCIGSSNHISNNKRMRLEKETKNIFDNESLRDSNLNTDCKENEILSSPNKKLGDIVDEKEIVLRYLNAKKENIDTTSNEIQVQNFSDSVSSSDYSNSELSGIFNILGTNNVVNKEISYDVTKKQRLSKSSLIEIAPSKNVNLEKSAVITISSDQECGRSPHYEEELQSDIIADMLKNIKNEVICSGDSFHTYDKVSMDGSSFNHSGGESKIKKILTLSPAAKTINCVIKNLKPEKSLENDRNEVIVISDSEKDGENRSVTDNNVVVIISDSEDEVGSEVKNNKITTSFQQKSSKDYFSPEKDISIKNCKVIIEDFSPLKQPAGNNVSANKSVDGQNSNSTEHNLTTIPLEQRSLPQEKNTDRNIKCKDNLSSPKVLEKPSPESSYTHQSEGFEGFTEQDILILTVKLALFKMNGGKCSDISCDSSLYNIDGKQILIKDVSQGIMKCSSMCSISSNTATISSSVQTDNETVFTPSPSTSRIRPVSIAKLRGLEREVEKFENNDIVDTRDPITPTTPLEQEEMLLPAHTSSSSVNRSINTNICVTPVSRRQLSFMSPAENSLQPKEVIAGHSKDEVNVLPSSSSDDWRVLHYRMRYMMPSCHEESFHNESERLGCRPTRLTFTTCGLNGKETALVTKLAQMTKSCLTKDFTHDTTHLVIGATGRGTLEYYLAIAYRAFIVTMEWVSLCIAFNKILPVTGFIPTEDEGPLKCLEPISPPFIGFSVCSKVLHGASTYPIADITKTLLSLGGARLFPEIDSFSTLQDGHFPRFFVYGKSSQINQAVIDVCASLHVVPVQFTWVYESISAFRAQPIMDFLGTVIHSRTLIRDYKIPEHLACSRYPRLEGEFLPQILDERYQRSL